jgi:carboxypeptidase Taq
MEKFIKIYTDMRERIKAYEYLKWLVSWDMETEAPKASAAYRNQQVGVLSKEVYQLESDPDYINAIETLHENKEQLDAELQVEIKDQMKALRIIKKVPKEEYIAYQILLSDSSLIWSEAKDKDDFEHFAPTLEKIVAFNKKLVKYLETDEFKGYDILLDMYEEGFGIKEYDLFFNELKAELVPFVLEVTQQNKRRFSKKLTKGKFPIEQQRAFAHYLMKVFGYDLNRGLLKESSHPFTSGVSSTDTRITTHYHEDNPISSIFSTIHEMGHALYELNNDPKYDHTFLHGGSSLGIHESQSRMYENMIARSKAFWETHYQTLVEHFPKQLKGIELEEFYQFINQAQRSLIRIEADELTYSLHVMVRYEIEKQLINGKLKVKDLPSKWRSLMSSYVGKRPSNNKEGVLQDIHWSFGAFGYFPTYALGSAYAAQIYQAMAKEINIEQAIKENQIERINAWLKAHVHTFGKTKTPKEILLIASKESFNPKYYTQYLKDKFKTN